MQIDRYTKIVLTVIAVALAAIAVRGFQPAPAIAQAAAAVAGDWHLGITQHEDGANAWRLNSLTGQIGYCHMTEGALVCFDETGFGMFMP